MKKLTILCLSILVFACKNEPKETNSNTTEIAQDSIVSSFEDDPVLMGYQDISVLKEAPYNLWFDKGYESYEPNAETLKAIKPHLEGDISIKMFMGTWCEDSHREVPGFIKILDALKFPKDKLTTVMINEDKNEPADLLEGYNITNVPTIIFYRDGEEINRIVEIPIENVEKDMLTILCGQFYRHAYDF
ncbi:MAG: thioredoxin family protein [Flavobacteriaceae bacterium]|nr:thioredoxin family protein [Flavobacteriaceae bacterium]